jgi:hypothetical protein
MKSWSSERFEIVAANAGMAALKPLAMADSDSPV